MSKYTLGGDPPQSRAEQILMGEDVIPQSRLEELLLEQSVTSQSRIEDLLNEDADPGSVVLINKTIESNGTYNAASDNADGYKRVIVNVPQGSTPTGTKTINISANGTTVEDVAAYANAQIVVAVPIPSYPIAENNSFGGGS